MTATLPGLAPLGHLQPANVIVRDTWAELRQRIDHAIDNQPRTLQTAIGPSELGTPCTRCLIHKLAGHTEQRTPGTSWLPYVGTCVHAELADTFIRDNETRLRWLVETTVDVGEVAGVPITGHADLFDIETGTVTDWKIVGKTTLDKVRRARHPGPGYRIQSHAYGRGFVRRGLTVTTVQVAFLPRNEPSLSGAFIWSEPYDEQVALDALERADRLSGFIATFGVDAVLASAGPHLGEYSCSRWPDATPRPADPAAVDRQLDGLIAPHAPAAHPGAGSTAA